MATVVGTGSNTVYFSFKNGGNQLVSIQESDLSITRAPSDPVPSALISSDARSMSSVVAVGEGAQIHAFWTSLLDNSIRHARSADGGLHWDSAPVPYTIPYRTLEPLSENSMGVSSLSGDSMGSQALVISGANAYKTSDSGLTWSVTHPFGSSSFLTNNPTPQVKKVIAEGGKFHLFADGVYAFTSNLDSNWTVRPNVPNFSDLPFSMNGGREWAVNGNRIVVPSVSCLSSDPKFTSGTSLTGGTVLYFVGSEDAGASWTHSNVFNLSSQSCLQADILSIKMQPSGVLLMLKSSDWTSSKLMRAEWSNSSKTWSVQTLLSGNNSSGPSFYINGANMLDGHIVVNYIDNSKGFGEQNRLASYSPDLLLESDDPVGFFYVQPGMVSNCLSLSSTTLCPTGNGAVYQRGADPTNWNSMPVDKPSWGAQLLLKFNTATAESVSIIYQNPFDGFLKVAGSTDGGSTWQ